jgi:hypothetical protein
MAGFERIDLTKKIERKKEDSTIFMTVKKKTNIKFPLKLIVILLIFLVAIGAFIVMPAYATYKTGMKTYTQAKLIATAMKQQNVALASEELDKTKQYLSETRKSFDKMFYLRFIPLANFYYNDADHALRAADKGLSTTTIVIDSLKPYADVLGLKGSGSFVTGSAEDRIKTAVMTMGKITPQIDTIADSLSLVQKEVDAISPSHYPEIIFGKKPKTQLTQIRELTDQSVELVNQARPLIKVLPSLLGESEQKKYLVLFQNDKELRSTGGFITAYSIMAIDKGKLIPETSEDIYTLDNTISNKPVAPEPILKYLPKVSVLNLRDSNISPDYVKSMETFLQLYNKAGARVPIDGIIAIDTNVLVSTIKILDDQVTASGLTFTTQNDARCDCPQVIYALEDNISRPVNYVKTERKGLIGSLINAIMVKALSSSPKIYWGPLFQTMLMQTNQKHILFYLFDKEAQKGIEAMNAGGRIQSFEGDYLHINDTNFGGQKSNLFTSEAVQSDYSIDKDGSIQKTITITYRNDFPPSNCNLEAGQLCLNAVLRNWLRIYVPEGSQLIESKGSQVKMSTYNELGKTVFEGFLTVRPLGQSKFAITYKLPFKLSSGSPLPVLIQKQPGTDGNDYTVSVNGKTIEEFRLFADKKMQLKI